MLASSAIVESSSLVIADSIFIELQQLESQLNLKIGRFKGASERRSKESFEKYLHRVKEKIVKRLPDTFMLEVLRQNYSRTAWSKCFVVKLESLERIWSVERHQHSSLQS